MPTIIGILTFISRINTAYVSFKARNILICQHFRFLLAVEKSFINLGCGHIHLVYFDCDIDQI